jgi:AraC-like DNA-binding protein
LHPFASLNDVDLKFKPTEEVIVINYYPEEFVSQLLMIFYRIVTLTPQKHRVEIHLKKIIVESGNQLLLTIYNSGTYLGSIEKSIIKDINFRVITTRYKSGTKFEIKYPQIMPEILKDKHDFHLQENNYTHNISPFFQKFREHLKSRFTSIANIEAAAEKRSPGEGIFMKKVNAVIQAHLESEGFNTKALAGAMAMSRSQLYRKLKPLIGNSPSWYIRNFKLLKAKEMLEKEDCTIGEASFKTGFISQSHFTRAFKEHFGFNPSSLKNRST